MRRLLALAVGTGLVLTTLPALAAPLAAPPKAAPPKAAEQQARRLLERAALAGRALSYSGTQYAATWRAGAAAATVTEVQHAPGGPAVVDLPGPADAPVVATAALDARLVGLLAASYDLHVTGEGRCAGRRTSVVEARDPGGAVAGRFWLDRVTGLLLRREVYDGAGRPARSSAFVDLDVRRPTAGTAPLPAAQPAPGTATATALRAQGWPVPESLAGRLRLFAATLSAPRPGEHLLHLAYSDGLSTASLFVQRGRLGTRPLAGFAVEQVGRRPVWVRAGAPERAVWSGDGRVWTLVSDAPAETVRAAVTGLPRDPAAREGVLVRLRRGFARLAALLNPFD